MSLRVGPRVLEQPKYNDDASLTEEPSNTSKSVMRKQGSRVYGSATGLLAVSSNGGSIRDAAADSIRRIQTARADSSRSVAAIGKDLNTPPTVRVENGGKAPTPMEALKNKKVTDDKCRRVISSELHKAVIHLPRECWRYLGPTVEMGEQQCSQIVGDNLKESVLSKKIENTAAAAVDSLQTQCDREMRSDRGVARALFKIAARNSLEAASEAWENEAAKVECSENFNKMLELDKKRSLKRLNWELNTSSSREEMREIEPRNLDFFHRVAQQEFQRICVKKQMTNVPLDQ